MAPPPLFLPFLVTVLTLKNGFIPNFPWLIIAVFGKVQLFSSNFGKLAYLSEMPQGFGNLYPWHHPPSPIGNVDISILTFGEILQALLEKCDLSMSGFASAIGMSTAQVSRIIAGTRTPAYEFTGKMCAALGLKGPDERWFEELVRLAHADREIWRNYLSLKVQVYRRELKIAELLEKQNDGRDHK